MFFDTNKIHIQAFVNFINGKLIMFQSSSPQKTYFSNIYTLKNKKIKKRKTKKNKKKQITKQNETNWYLGHTDSENVRFLMSHIDKNNIFPR